MKEKENEDIETKLTSPNHNHEVTNKRISEQMIQTPNRCWNCHTAESENWIPYLENNRTDFLCHSCGKYWLKTAHMRIITESLRRANREKGVLLYMI